MKNCFNEFLTLSNQSDYIFSILSQSGFKKNDLSVAGFGCFGVAFFANDEIVIKVTTDQYEIEIAKNLKGKINEYSSDIYEVIIIDNAAIIFQERLKTNDLFLNSFVSELSGIMLDLYIDFNQIRFNHEIIKEIKQDLNKKQKLFFDEIVLLAKLNSEEIFNKTGLISNDFHLYNIGFKKNGRPAFFDMSKK